MTQVKIRRAYEKPQPDDGFRVLVDRLWPRGLRKNELRYDLWDRDIAPSTALRRWYHEDMQNRWDAFRQRYLEELKTSPVAEELIRRVVREPTVTLVYASKNTLQNHALILKAYLEKQL